MIFLYFIGGTPIQEEVIFRGLLQTVLERRLATGFPILGTTISSAVVLIAVLFGLIHLRPLRQQHWFSLPRLSFEIAVMCSRKQSM
jgi:membrane protease YdiL (CAAX protease family)